ncbi:uncharacterized protein B0I36DRAFT_50347 [Microdochium trichocladiopsis]|uniref:Zn(2)-C6 fungal-type domain-containing protein n=1 Tax=Microdochium trichocladiopsis TaxID=1682393 RepID=A0A9P8XSC4_9PEZI|nr:uncharacterized protein B0I36DRAFT_50347 [Microdochium trichocladiopsis]KAH7014529.1 hypothetical protein B0I36DRAFT_50347 [Microdochium trichocladiopsis]
MPPSRSGRSGVPEAFIIKWRQAPGNHATVHPQGPALIRRPATACSNCRSAKTRCKVDAAFSGSPRDCRRCAVRGLNCTWSAVAASPTSTTAFAPSPSVGTAAESSRQSFLSGNHLEQQILMAQNSPNAATDNDDLASDFVEKRCSNWAPGISSSLQTQVRPAHGTDQCQTISSKHDASDPDGQDDRSSASQSATSRSPAVTSVSSQSRLTLSCSCRGDLMLCVKKIARIMQQPPLDDIGQTSTLPPPRLDKVFAVTATVIDQAQKVLNCKTETLRCTDLLHIMSALQEAMPCFTHISQSLLNSDSWTPAVATEASGHEDMHPPPSNPNVYPDGRSAQKLLYGDHAISLSDSTALRALLATSIVSRATALVMAVRQTGQKMLDDLLRVSALSTAISDDQGAPDNALARANIAYLEANITVFQGMLKKVLASVDDAIGQEGAVDGGGDGASVFRGFAAALLG